MFFTPTSSRRSRILPQPQQESTRDSDDSSSSSRPSTSEGRGERLDLGEAGPSWSSSLPQAKTIKKAGCPSVKYPPKAPEDSKKSKSKTKAAPKKKSRKPHGSSSEEEEEEIIPSGEHRKYFYKGFWFADCPNGVLDPNGIGAKELIEVFKSMEAMNRKDPNFKEFSDIDSDTSFEEDKTEPDRHNFRDTNDYLNYCKKKLQRKMKVRDGLTRKQRREHRQFKREFAELLQCLEHGHIAVCDDEFNDYFDLNDKVEKNVKIEPDSGNHSTKKLKNSESHLQYSMEYEMFSDTDDEYHCRNHNGRNFDYEEPMEEGQPIPAEDLVDCKLLAFVILVCKSLGSELSKSFLHIFYITISVREQFEALDFKPVVDRVPSWREMLPPKSPRAGHSRASPESSITTLSNEVSILFSL